jgi:threonine 3-dehydrogenase
MKALVKAEAAPGLIMRNESVPAIGTDDVLIRINKTGICGTDLHIWKWDAWAQKTIPVPMVVGHEFAGEVVEIGSHVRTVKVGDRVSGEGHLIGMKSRMARAGHFHLDPETRGVGVNVPGAFAEYMRLPAFNIIHLPTEIDDEIGAILDPLGNAVHTALSFDLVGEDVLITGAGPIGIMAGAVCRHVGARHVVITDVNEYRLRLATEVADIIPVNVAREDLRSVMDRIGMQEGFDVGLEMSGAPPAFSQMVDLVIMGGRIAMLGIPSSQVPVDWNKIIFKSLTIKGIYGREMFETWYKMIAMLQSGLDVRKVITHRMKAVDYAQGFELMGQGECGKVVLDWK